MNSAKASQEYTMEEKVKRLQELMKGYREDSDDLYKLVLQDVAFYSNMKEVCEYYRDQVLAKAAWDVHTGAAFTPLYRML